MNSSFFGEARTEPGGSKNKWQQGFLVLSLWDQRYPKFTLAN
jgi:hypothetical protein